jgi:methylmalonyl-CoA mutase N-terminal domain/subunit
VDPVGGSWFVERLTADLESAAEALVAEIDARGGAVECIDFMRDAIHDAAYRYHQAVRDGTRPVVGLNAHVEDEEPPIEILRIDLAIERDQVARLGGLRARRDNALVQRLLGDVEAAARGDANLLYPMREALRAKATVGEVSGVLRVVFGEYDRLIATRG